MQEFSTKVQPKLQLSNTFYHFRKYNILKILNSLPADQCMLFKKELPGALGVNRQTFANWLNAGIADTLEIPSIKLAQIACFFQIAIEELLNIPVQKIEIKSQAQKLEEEIFNQIGLVK
jgi:DNA-binding XRE family transcriptional regulator